MNTITDLTPEEKEDDQRIEISIYLKKIQDEILFTTTSNLKSVIDYCKIKSIANKYGLPTHDKIRFISYKKNKILSYMLEMEMCNLVNYNQETKTQYMMWDCIANQVCPKLIEIVSKHNTGYIDPKAKLDERDVRAMKIRASKLITRSLFTEF